ncbi:MAG: two-component regulator propeller domain-containing protein, partial [Bacteroidales bacterium]
MRRFLTITGIILSSSFTLAQTPVGEWTDHLIYNSASCVAAGSKEIFASTGSSVLIYNKQYAELRKLSKVTGLSETGISSIAWSEENSTLIIAYTTTNIDLVKGNSIYNIPDIERKYIPGKKNVNRIRTDGRYAYLACSFGIVVIDLIRNEIFDTWKPGNGLETAEVKDIAFGNGKVYAATNIGVYYADITNSGLAYFGNWSLLTTFPSPGGNFNLALFSGNKLYVNRTGQYFPGDTIYVVQGSASVFSYVRGRFNTSFDNSDNGFTISSGSSAAIYNIDGSLSKTISSYGWGSPAIAQIIIEGSDAWISDINAGLVFGKNISEYSALTLPGPVSNNAINIMSFDGKTIICGGGIDASWNNLWRPLQISIYENNGWTGISSSTVSDAMRAVVDPSDKTHFFVSTWGGGLLEYKNNLLVNHFTEANSPLQTIISGAPYVRVCGLAMDKERNLWITQTEVTGSIKVLKPDGTWIVNPLTIDANDIGDIIITRTGQKWMVLPRGNGLAIYDDNGTPSNFDDDNYIKMTVTDSDNEVISNVYSIAEDLDGNIWVGTDKGPLIYYNPDKVFEGDLKAYRIKVPRNDGTGLADYMLGTETITSISVDGANRKWLGTMSSGAYLLSADGMKQIKNLNEDNSPMLSNVISSVAVDGKTGDVWFATSKGIISYRGDATAGKESFTNVYSFPNPVRENFTGNVTITGLVRNTEIRITDVS